MLSSSMAEKEKNDQESQSDNVDAQKKAQAEKRVVKLTAKALLLKINNFESDRKAKFNKLLKLRQTITVLKNENGCLTDIKEEFKRFLGLSEETMFTRV